MRRILVAVDETEASRDAARMAVEYAERLGARLTFVHVLPPDSSLEVPEFAAFERACEARAAQLLEEACQLTGIPRPQVDTQVRHGDPVEVLCTAARAEDVDLVMTGTRERGALARALLGSVAMRLVSQCPKPVLVVPHRNAPAASHAPEEAPARVEPAVS
ncbi:universal stress protein [Pyxidicoccus fallax]|uniref:Universal stress protein n=1 Tax=Pyxidicoccus fallax TaxID=394095 RepID=A0A848M2E4_9BACT|nr:universal stress protein [Pyxidicoccus fallax]NMO23643.1 universal stress protein [Pyxidicoccus fallax]NPC87126.1 universal stress protein [Pyxidicoccus fallax]